MSYDISLCDAITGEVLQLDQPHHMRGGTYAIGGTRDASLNVTYNYYKHYQSIGGIRAIYGLTGAKSLPLLAKAIAALGDDIDSDYWRPTEGNAKRALIQLQALAQMRPDGVWQGD